MTLIRNEQQTTAGADAFGLSAAPGGHRRPENLIYFFHDIVGVDTIELRARVLARNRLADTDYGLSQLRYDLAKLRAKGLVQRVGRTRRYHLTLRGARLGVLIVKLRTRLLGPIATLATQPCVGRSSHHNPVDAAFHRVDSALDQLCVALGLQLAA